MTNYEGERLPIEIWRVSVRNDGCFSKEVRKPFQSSNENREIIKQEMAKKNIVILLSRKFMLGHSKAGEPTHFEERLKKGRKIHTIRANYDWWKHSFDKMKSGNFRISIRQWTERPYNSKQKEIASISNPEVGIQRIRLTYDALTRTMDALIDESHSADVRDIARNDGFDDLADFQEWFFGKEPKDGATFNGVILHLTSFRY